MKKVIIYVGINLPSEDIANLESKIRHDYETGIIILPFYCKATIIDDCEMPTIKTRPQPDMSKVTRYHDNSIDALIDEALDELSETKHQTSEETDNLCEVHLLSKKQDVPFCEVKTERGGANNE